MTSQCNRGCWCLMLVCILCRVLPIQSEESCSGVNCTNSRNPDSTFPPTINPSGTQGNPSGLCTHSNGSIALGETLHRTVLRPNGTKAIDLCFVVSTTRSMTGLHRWLQVAVPYLEESLTGRGIGSANTPNRYCLVSFGGRFNLLTGTFVRVQGEIFFPAQSFVDARRQLRRNGDVADGYEALEFTIRNAPFREDPNIPKAIILVSDMGRSVLATKTNLTRDSIASMLREHNVILDTVVSVEIRVSDPLEIVLGLNVLRPAQNFSLASVLRPDGRFELVMGTMGSVFFTSSAGQTIHDYIILALVLGGSSWPIELLSEVDENIQKSFAEAFIATHGFSSLELVEACERCVCTNQREDVHLQCEYPPNQELCRCLINRTATECDVVLPSPTRTIPAPTEVTSLLPAVRPTSTPVLLTIDGAVRMRPGGDVEVTFESDVEGVEFECILLNDLKRMPTVTACSSPYVLKNLTEGDHNLLVIGRYRGVQTTRIFQLSPEPLEVSITRHPPSGNGSVLVDFSANREDVRFMCYLSGRDFSQCRSPQRIDSRESERRVLFFIVVATDSRGSMASAVITIERPMLPTPGPPLPPVMIDNVTVEEPQPGIVVVHFIVSREDADCICRLDGGNPMLCQNTTIVEDQELGRHRTFMARDLDGGDHNLIITCMAGGYSDTNRTSFTVTNPRERRRAPEPLFCEVNVREPTLNSGILAAKFSCNRKMIYKCQVDYHPSQPCIEWYEFDTSALDPGHHMFTLIATDHLGDSLMKIVPFRIHSAHRRCCPVINRKSSTLSRESSLRIDLQLLVNAGNCSQNEGFSYVVNWGDEASDTGVVTHLTPINTSRTYSAAGDYTVEIAYCNNPVEESNICCDSFSLLANLQDTLS